MKLLGAAVLGLIALSVAIGASPVSLTIEHDAGTGPELSFDGHRSQTLELPKRGMRRVRLTDVSPPDRVLELVLPIQLEGERLKVEQLERADGWVPTAGRDRVISTTPGSELQLYGYFEDLDLLFVGSEKGGAVQVESDGFSQTFDLAQPTYDYKPLKLPSARRFTVREFSLFECPSALHLSGLTPRSEVTLRLAQGTTLFSSVVDGPELDVPIPGRWALAGGVLAQQGPLLSVLAVAVVMLAVAWLIGWLILALLGLAHPSTRGRLAAIVTGASALSLIANSLAYVVGTDATAPWVRGLLVAALGAAIFVRRRVKPASVEPGDELPGDVVLLSVAGVFATFWPILIGGLGSLGMLRTDSFYYTTVSEVIGEQSLLSNPLSTIGHGLRSIDVALGAHAASVLGVTSNAAWLALCAATLFLSPLLVFYVVKDWVGHVNVARLAAAYFSVFPALSGLFVEVYLSHFLLTPALLGALFLATPLYQQARARTLTVGSTTPLALVLAVSLLLYPYFALTAALTVPVLFFVIEGSLKERLKWTAWLGAQVLLVSNVGLWFFGNQASAGAATTRLNEIAQWVVFPFADQPRFGAFFLGLVPFHAEPSLLGGVIAEYSNAPVLTNWMRAVEWLYTSPLTPWVMGLILVVFVAATLSSLKALTRSPIGVLLVLSVPLLVLMATVVRLTSGLYAYCKLMWTMSTLWPLVAMPPLALAMLGLGRTGRLGRGVRVASVLTVVLLFSGALVSKVFGSVLWLGHEHGVARNIGLAGDLQRIDQWRKTVAPEARRFAFITPDGAPLDQARRVLSGHVYSILETSGWECVNAGMSIDALIWMGPDTLKEEPKIVISLGAIRTPGPGWRELVRGDLLSVLERVP